MALIRGHRAALVINDVDDLYDSISRLYRFYQVQIQLKNLVYLESYINLYKYIS